MEIPSKDICAQVYFPHEHYLWKRYHRPQITAHKEDGVLFLPPFFVCVTKNAQTNCQCVSSHFIASKTQETHSRGNTGRGCDL